MAVKPHHEEQELGNETSREAAKLQIFLSYSRRDIEFADQLSTALEAFDYDVIIDRKDIQGAEDWRERLYNMILQADTIVFLLTPNSAISEICQWEVETAVGFNKRIVPVLITALGPTKPPSSLQKLNYIRFYSDAAIPGSGWGQGLAQLSATLSVDIEWIREHTRIGEIAERWEKEGRTKDLLARGTELRAMQQWRNRRPANAPDLSSLQRAYLEASEAAELEFQGQERLRIIQVQAAQDAQSKALEDTKRALEQKAEEQRRRSRLRNILLAVLVIGTAGIGYQYHLSSVDRTQARLLRVRAEQAEQAAVKAETDAKTASLHAIINEFTTSSILLKAEPNSVANIDNFLDTGTRLGFALIRSDRNQEAKAQFASLQKNISSWSVDKASDAIDFYLALVNFGIVSASVDEDRPNDEASLQNALEHSVEQLKKATIPARLQSKLIEERFRAYFYLVNFQLQRRQYDAACLHASEIDHELSEAPGQSSILRVRLRAMGLLAWCDILSRKPADALTVSSNLLEMSNRPEFADLASLKLNYAHALLVNNQEAAARAEYAKFNPDDVRKDFKEMQDAGLCYPIFAEYGADPRKC